MLASAITACGAALRDEVTTPTEQAVAELKSTIQPAKAVSRGVFHMQAVGRGNEVLLQTSYRLKKPELPPFDVSYISKDVESIVLELANTAGESVAMPPELREKRVTIFHTGATFPEMLSLVLSKIGYSWDYKDGVWQITKYPVRYYQIDITQSNRRGSLASSAEIGAQNDESASSPITGQGQVELDTSYSDDIWAQVEETLELLIDDGSAARGDIEIQAARSETQSEMPQEPLQLLEVAPSTPSESVLDKTTPTVTPSNSLPVSKSIDHLLPEDRIKPGFTISESASIITVRTSPAVHDAIQAYLEKLQQSLHRQVYVEMRIVALLRDKTTNRGGSLSQSVNLGDPHNKSILGAIGFNPTRAFDPNTIPGGFLNFSTGTQDMQLIMQQLSAIGDVYTISSPSVLARNNQLARVGLTRQLGFAETTVETNTTSNGDLVLGLRTDEAKFKNAGTILSVLPFIGRRKVTLRLRLSIAAQSGTVTLATALPDNDPVTQEVPELSNNVIDQDLVLDYGRVYAISNLIETSTSTDFDYSPTLAQIPGIKEVFQRAINQKQDTEFLVLLKVNRS